MVVDPNPGNPIAWRRMTAIKPNRVETIAALGSPVAGEVGDGRAADHLGRARHVAVRGRQSTVPHGGSGEGSVRRVRRWGHGDCTVHVGAGVRGTAREAAEIRGCGV